MRARMTSTAQPTSPRIVRKRAGGAQTLMGIETAYHAEAAS